MHPTAEEQLRAMRRVLDEIVATEGALTAGSAEALRAVSGQMRRLEGSLAERLPFLVADNAASTALLAEFVALAPSLGAELPPPTAGDREDLVHQTNKSLRALLARAVHELPDSPAGDAARARLAEHVRARLARDPSLNRARRTVNP